MKYEEYSKIVEVCSILLDKATEAMKQPIPRNNDYVASLIKQGAIADTYIIAARTVREHLSSIKIEHGQEL